MNKIDFISNEVPPLIKAYFEMTEPLNKTDVRVEKADVKLRQKDACKRSDNERRSTEANEMWDGNMPVLSNTQTSMPLQQYTLAHSIFDNAFSDLQ